LSRIKILNGPRVRGISPVGKEKIYGGNDLLKSQEKQKLGSILLLLSAITVVAFPPVGHYCLGQYQVILFGGSCDANGNGIT